MTEQEYAEMLTKVLDELATKAWESGILIKAVKLEDNWIKTHDKEFTVAAPKWTHFETDYMDIEIQS